MFAPFKEYGVELLKYDPEFVIERIGIETPDGDGYLKGVVSIKGATADDFATGSMGVVSKIHADLTIDVSEKMIQKFPNGSTGAGAAVNLGYAERKGDRLICKIVFADGQLTVNGKPQAIPGLGGPPPVGCKGAEPPPQSRIAPSNGIPQRHFRRRRARHRIARDRSGEKYMTAQGFTAIKDGQKPRAATVPAPATGRKPAWIRAQLPVGTGFGAVKDIVHEHRLATVCEEAKCPNIGECWNAGTATIMLMGAVCTRACRFCSVDTGNPRGWLDAEEPENTARSVELMKLKYIVLTSVNRDDLPDGGAEHYAAAIRAIKRRTPHVAVEALTPDFQGVMRDVETVVDSGLEVFAQNVETVKRLTHPVRDARAGYEQTIAVLAHAKQYKPSVLTKTSLMLGLGETDEEIAQTMDDLRAANVDLLTLGQYLRPTVHHLPVQRFVTPASSTNIASGRWRKASASASQVRWCAPATAPNRRWPATTPASRIGKWGHLLAFASKRGRTSNAPAPIRFEMARARGVRTHLARDAAHHRHARREHAGRDLAARASAGVHARPQRRRGPRARRGRHPRGQDRPRRAGDLSRPRPARGLSTHRHPPRGPRRARSRDRDGARRHRLLREPRHHGRVPQAAPGVYVDGRKIASVGIRIRRGASYHGLAFNVNMDLEPFQRINPCGYAGLQMTQLAALGQPDATVEATGRAFAPFLKRSRSCARSAESPPERAMTRLSSCIAALLPVRIHAPLARAGRRQPGARGHRPAAEGRKGRIRPRRARRQVQQGRVPHRRCRLGPAQGRRAQGGLEQQLAGRRRQDAHRAQLVHLLQQAGEAAAADSAASVSGAIRSPARRTRSEPGSNCSRKESAGGWYAAGEVSPTSFRWSPNSPAPSAASR